MPIAFDESTRRRDMERHGFDLADFARCFDHDGAERIDTVPSRTGRTRYLLVGRWNDEVVVLAVISPLGGEAQSPVSLRGGPGREGHL